MENHGLIDAIQGNIKILKFNKPHRKNAVDRDMYIKLTKALNDAAENKDISVVVLTGTGNFYSSGNDLKVETALSGSLLNVINELLIAIIKFPKPLVAIVNGPAVGIAVTTLALCDFVFAEDNAYFYTPFGLLGVVPEGCSTYTFPKLMGHRKAMELLMLNKKMSAKEALDCGLVNNVWGFEELESKAWQKIEEIAKIPLNNFMIAKKLFRKTILDKLLEANVAEMDALQLLCGDAKSKL